MTTLSKGKKICIVGSGLVGALLATLLAQAGFDVDVYEKRKDPRKDRKENKTRGRSIALSLSDRGWKALRQAGLEKIMRPQTNPAYGRIVHQKNGEAQYQDYGDGTQAIWTINRNYLNNALIKKANSTGKVKFFFQHTVENINEKTGNVVFLDLLNRKKIMIKHYDHIVGVDGIFSSVRKAMINKGLCNFENYTFDFGYKELCIPADENGKHVLDGNRTHVWPRKNSVLIAFPTIEGNFVCSLFLPLEGRDSLKSINTSAKLAVFFEREYKEVFKLIPNLKNGFFKNPNSTLTQVKGAPWYYKDKILLMGDACHAITPFYGMGMNIGFEDCTTLMSILQENKYNFGKAFKLLNNIRKPNTDAMTELSYKNFKSINESPDPDYQTKWLLERRIWKLFPNLWAPVYALIAFSEVPLKDVPMIKDKQDYVLNKLVSIYPSILDLTDEQLSVVVEPMLVKQTKSQYQEAPRSIWNWTRLFKFF